MKTILTVLLVTILAGCVSSNALAQSPLDKYRGKDAQRCAVVDCSSPSPPAPSTDSGTADARTDSPVRKDRSESASDRYDRINAQARRVWKAAMANDSYSRQTDGYREALKLFREQQALRDGRSVRDAISQLEAGILWNSGIISDQNKEYWRAFQELNEAYRKRPDLFSEGNFNYMRAVFKRHLNSVPNGTPALMRQMEREEKERLSDATLVDAQEVSSGLPISVINAIADVFSDAPPGVSDRVRKGFQAVMTKDWDAARAWFQDALNRDPGNAGLKSFIVAVDSPMDQTFRRLEKDRYTDFAKNPLHTLNDHATTLSKEQITKVLDAILVEATCPICRQPRAKQ